MTYSIEARHVPQVPGSYEAALLSHQLVGSNIALLEEYIEKLSARKDQLLRQQTSILQEIQQYEMMASSVGRLPVASIAKFLTANGLCNLGAVSRHFHEECCPNKKAMVVHLTTPKRGLSREDARGIVNRLLPQCVETLHVDARRSGGKQLMSALVEVAPNMIGLRSLRVSAAAETGAFQESLSEFMSRLPSNVLTSVHLSGFRSLTHVSALVADQTESLEHFKVDYFVNGHEPDIDTQMFPVMPRLKSLVFDVADVVDLPVEVILDRLRAVQDKASTEILYLPHMQIGGDSFRIKELVGVLREFTGLRQLVVRFRHLPLSVTELVSLRESFASLPAVCISDHFIVMLDSWASWWPQQTAIWDSPEKINGLSVFREQIDFESLGTTAAQEWSRLSESQRAMWSSRIAPQVLKLYLQQYTSALPVQRSASM